MKVYAFISLLASQDLVSAPESRLSSLLIDSQNLNLGVRSQDWKLDFGKFRQYLMTKYKADKTFLFIGYIQGNQTLYTYLQSVGYICVFKPTLELKKGKKERHSRGEQGPPLVVLSS